jgi:hypothetical protein
MFQGMKRIQRIFYITHSEFRSGKKELDPESVFLDDR